MAAPPRASGLLTINNSYISHRRTKTSASLAAIGILITPLVISPLIYQRVSGWDTGMFLYLYRIGFNRETYGRRRGPKNIEFTFHFLEENFDRNLNVSVKQRFQGKF